MDIRREMVPVVRVRFVPKRPADFHGGPSGLHEFLDAIMLIFLLDIFLLLSSPWTGNVCPPWTV